MFHQDDQRMVSMLSAALDDVNGAASAEMTLTSASVSATATAAAAARAAASVTPAAKFVDTHPINNNSQQQ